MATTETEKKTLPMHGSWPASSPLVRGCSQCSSGVGWIRLIMSNQWPSRCLLIPPPRSDNSDSTDRRKTVVVAAIESIHGLQGCVGERILPGWRTKSKGEEVFHDSSTRHSWLCYLELLYFQLHSGAQLMMILITLASKEWLRPPKLTWMFNNKRSWQVKSFTKWWWA